MPDFDAEAERPLRIVVMGNGPFAVPMLHALVESRHQVLRVVARPDVPDRRGRTQPGPVAAWAAAQGLPLFQPASVNAADQIAELAALEADVLAVADFGQILKATVLETARLGGVNVHGSLLPRHRGAAPVAWAILHGDAESGVSLIHMTPRMDAGGVIDRVVEAVGPADTAGTLEERLAAVGAARIVPTLESLAAGAAVAQPQDPALVTAAPKLTKADGRLDWTRSADALERQVRALQPWPVAFTELRPHTGKLVRLQILAAEPVAATGTPGEIVDATPDRLVVATGAGGLSLVRVKPAGKRDMAVAEFLRGRAVQLGDTCA